MTGTERQEIRELPAKYRPIGAWGYFWLTIVFSIPLLGWIILIICALSSGNINRRSFARSYFCGIIIALIIIGIMIFAAGGVNAALELIKNGQFFPKTAS